MYPGKSEGFLMDFQLFVPRLIKLAEADEKKYPPEKCKVFAEGRLFSPYLNIFLNFITVSLSSEPITSICR